MKKKDRLIRCHDCRHFNRENLYCYIHDMNIEWIDECNSKNIEYNHLRGRTNKHGTPTYHNKLSYGFDMMKDDE